MKITKMKKKNIEIFNKLNYLLGTTSDGTKVFLEKESWDCGWYWGFGYLETYTNNNNPENSHDIISHSHLANFDIDDENLYVLNQNHTLTQSTLNEKEMIKFKNLMKRAKELLNIAKEDKHKEKINIVNHSWLPIIFNNIENIFMEKQMQKNTIMIYNSYFKTNYFIITNLDKEQLQKVIYDYKKEHLLLTCEIDEIIKFVVSLGCECELFNISKVNL